MNPTVAATPLKLLFVATATLSILVGGCSDDPKIDRQKFISAMSAAQKGDMEAAIAATGEKPEQVNTVLEIFATCIYDKNISDNANGLQAVIDGKKDAVANLIEKSGEDCLSLDSIPNVGS